MLVFPHPLESLIKCFVARFCLTQGLEMLFDAIGPVGNRINNSI